MPTLPRLGDLPSIYIREGCKGPNDPAVENWDATFGTRLCGDCAKLGSCTRRYERPEPGDRACVLDFERKP